MKVLCQKQLGRNKSSADSFYIIVWCKSYLIKFKNKSFAHLMIILIALGTPWWVLNLSLSLCSLGWSCLCQDCSSCLPSSQLGSSPSSTLSQIQTLARHQRQVGKLITCLKGTVSILLINCAFKDFHARFTSVLRIRNLRMINTLKGVQSALSKFYKRLQFFVLFNFLYSFVIFSSDLKLFIIFTSLNFYEKKNNINKESQYSTG